MFILIICYNLSTSCDRKQLCITRGVIRNIKNTVHPWWQPFGNPSAYPSNTRKNSYLRHFFHDSINEKYTPDGSIWVWKCQRSSTSEGVHLKTPPASHNFAMLLALRTQLGQRAPTVSCWQDPSPQIRHLLVDHSRINIFIKDYLHRSSLRLCRTSQLEQASSIHLVLLKWFQAGWLGGVWAVVSPKKEKPIKTASTMLATDKYLRRCLSGVQNRDL